jgi:5-methyltetrahydropteroyltriglutamate--homocysteine methyltransferase
MRRDTPPFRADHVGSLLRPPELLRERQRAAEGSISAQELRMAEDEAICAAVHMQEEVGLQAVTDGEYRRRLWHIDVLLKFGNVSRAKSEVTVEFHSESGTLSRESGALRIDGTLTRPRPVLLADFAFLRSVSTVTPKVTMPSPSIMHSLCMRASAKGSAYRDAGEFYAAIGQVYREEIADLAEAGCRYLQLDDVNFSFFCDPELRAQMASRGEDPESLPAEYIALINEAVAVRPGDMAVTVHICRGNLQSAWQASGGYEPIAERLFNSLDVTGFFLEYDSPRAGDFAPLRFVPAGKMIVLGLVTTKGPALERKDELKRRIEEAARYVPLDQLALSPQCGFASGEQGNKLTIDDEIKKLELIVDVAHEVWG